ncbi:MAG: hypothetical protein A3C47_03235 [Omnitrophica bacterium RIFCSPHIGHO2_02_FULL_51_18]|nr:MAG: hypothetical protein A3C47_03235 [Omnitrophica bacterium RIFCSPHIGHO2_02_FULL_51_18]
MKNILFVCTGNSCRSVMAEALFREVTAGRPDDFSIHSAGISALDGAQATRETLQVMADHGTDVSEHRSQRLTEDMIRDADKIFVMERMHKDWIQRLAPEAESKVHLLTEFASKEGQHHRDIDIPDPIRMSDQFYKNVAVVIHDCVKNIAKIL